MSRVFLLLAILTISSSIQESPAITMDKLTKRWREYMEECAANHTLDHPSTGLVCNRTNTRYACWPDGLPNTTVSVLCPWYLPWYEKVKGGKVYQECDANGNWIQTKNTSECELNELAGDDIFHLKQYYMQIWIMYTVGYSLSLVALVLALGILICFRKLHCMRNNIHMNLFASFILRALSVLIKDAMMKNTVVDIALPDRDQDEGFPRATIPPVELFFNNETTIGCRIAMVMMQYGIMANSYWLLVEGIYLHNLLVIAVFTERNYFNVYLCIGWGAPLIFLVPWVTFKYLYENEECWERNINTHYWWIIRSPILLAVVINFLIFIHIINILVSKLRAHQMRYTDYKIRLAKSTLTLIPLLGIHQVVFIFATDESTQTTLTLRLTKLFIDLFFSSFQGLLVAILYCFVNKEVQSEVLKKWKRWKLGRNIKEEYRHTYSNAPNSKNSILTDTTRPHLSDVPPSSMPVYSLVEDHRLVGSYRNGTGRKKGGGARCTSSPHGGAISSCTVAENISLMDKAECCDAPMENAESHL